MGLEIYKEIINPMKHLQLFETYSDAEDVATELDNWIEANSDYLSASSLEDKVKELVGNKGVITVEEETIEDKGGMQYGENWNINLITVKLNGKDLMKVCTKSDGRYASGDTTNMFGDLPRDKRVGDYGARFYFDRSLL